MFNVIKERNYHTERTRTNEFAGEKRTGDFLRGGVSCLLFVNCFS